MEKLIEFLIDFQLVIKGVKAISMENLVNF